MQLSRHRFSSQYSQTASYYDPMKLSFLLFTLLLISCASSPTFKPEVDGAGAKSTTGGVVYSIPPKNPVLKMKLVSLGITKENMVHVQMFFLRKGAPAGEYLDPREQSISLPDSSVNIYPARVHASAAGKPLIKLADTPKEAVELLFPVSKGTHLFPYIMLSWKLHYVQDGQVKTMAETERFDLTDKSDPQLSVGHYLGYEDFPYAGYDPFPADWVTPGWLWW